MKEKVFNARILTMVDALTKRYALKKSVCYELVQDAKKEKCKVYICYFLDENGIEWGSCEISRVKDSWFNRHDFNLSFEHMTDDIDVATTYGIDIYKGKLDKEFAEYEVNHY